MSRQSKGKSPKGSRVEARPGAVSPRLGTSKLAAGKSYREWFVIVGLLLAVWVVFGQTIRHEFVNFDDDVYVTENEVVGQGLTGHGIVWAFTHAHGANWHPLTTLSHMVDCQLFGLDPAGPHLVNVLLHGATGCLLFLLLRSLTGDMWKSAFVAAVFALHPLRVESVAWVAERKDVLSGLFFVLTVGAYARYARKPFAPGAYAVVVVLFTLGLMCKPMLVTVPFVLLLLDYWPLARWPDGSESSRVSFKRLIGEKIPLLLLSALACVVTVLVQKNALQLAQHWSLPVRVGNAAVSYVAYLGQMIFPTGLAVLYPHPGNRLSVWLAGLCALALLVISVAVVVARRKRPYLAVGWFWYLGMLLPVIGLVQVGMQARADRYTYLPQIGLCILVAWGAGSLCSSWSHGRMVLRTAAVLIVVSLSIAARLQTAYWRDSISLWSHTVACTANNPIAYLNLGRALSTEGRYPEAIQQYEQALQLDPDHTEARISLGAALAMQGQVTQAIQNYERALTLKPDSPAAHYNLGTALASQGKFSEAIQHLERAVQLKPDYADAHVNLGNALGREGRTQEAIQHFESAALLRPRLAEIRVSLGNALGRDGKLSEAIQQFDQALKLKPNSAEAQCGWGSALAGQGKTNEATQHFQQALALATTQANAALAEYIREQIRLCQTGLVRPQQP